jgi:type I restriction enzyme R subunit
MVVSPNFAFLDAHDPQLVRLGVLAEQYFASDPNTCLIKLRQFGELLAQLAAAKVGLYVSSDERQIDLLRRLRERGLLKGEVDRLFHEVRRAGNEATHTLAGNHRTALIPSCSRKRNIKRRARGLQRHSQMGEVGH